MWNFSIGQLIWLIYVVLLPFRIINIVIYLNFIVSFYLLYNSFGWFYKSYSRRKIQDFEKYQRNSVFLFWVKIIGF